MTEYRQCPYCSREVPAEDSECRFCHNALTPPPPPPPAPEPQAGAPAPAEPPPPREQAGLSYPKAPIGRRILAYLVDSIIGALLIIILIPPGIFLLIQEMQAASSGVEGTGASWLAIFFLLVALGLIWAVVYTLIRDGLGRGQSLGKRMFGLMVVRLTDNRPCPMGSSVVRNLFYYLFTFALGWIPVANIFASWIEPIVGLAHEKGFRVGDMVAQTQVIDTADYRETLPNAAHGAPEQL